MTAPQDAPNQPPSTHPLSSDIAFARSVFDAVREIPEGRVTTSAHIAQLILHLDEERLVAEWLNRLKPRGDEHPILKGYDVSTVPWHRIVLLSGTLPTSTVGSPACLYHGGAKAQTMALREGGVRVRFGEGEERYVDVMKGQKRGWFPPALPSRELPPPRFGSEAKGVSWGGRGGSG